MRTYRVEDIYGKEVKIGSQLAFTFNGLMLKGTVLEIASSGSKFKVFVDQWFSDAYKDRQVPAYVTVKNSFYFLVLGSD